jgi:hypothetical protein
VSEQHYHFECAECGFDDEEHGVLAREKQVTCGICAEDCGRDVYIDRWPALEGKTRDEARKIDRQDRSAMMR